MTAVNKREGDPLSSDNEERRRALWPFARGHRSWLVLVVTAIGLVAIFGTSHQSGHSRMTFTAPNSLFRLPAANLPTGPTIYTLVILTVAAAILTLWLSRRRRRPNAVLISTLFACVAMLVWGTAGASTDVESLLVLTISWSIVLTIGACGGVMSERSGAINVALEGMMLCGAFVGVVVGSVAGVLVGILSAVALGGLLGWLLGLATIRYKADQLIVGIGINILALGLTSYLFNSLLNQHPGLNQVPRVGVWGIPGLSRLPLIGPALFAQRPFAYIAVVGAIALHFALRRTRWGLHVNAVGENPHAADSMGINVHRVRYLNMIYSGCIAAFAGTYLSTGLIGSFTLNMTNGIGYVALAIMIAGRWRPLGALGVALLFGFVQALQGQLSNSNSAIPSEVLLMLPYVVTIVIVVGVVGASVAPAADGQPFTKS